MIVPTFDERASISATDIVSVGRGSASSIVRSATLIDGGSVNVESGVTTWSVSAAAYVTTLKVEPGLVGVRDRAVPLEQARHLGEVVRVEPGAVAIASTPPVDGSSTIAVPSVACHFATVSRSTDSTFAWSVWSSVRKTSRPGCSGVDETTSIVRPSGSRTTVSLPGLPTRYRSRPSSSPAMPVLSTPA